MGSNQGPAAETARHLMILPAHYLYEVSLEFSLGFKLMVQQSHKYNYHKKNL